MNYEVIYSQNAIKELKKLDKHIRKLILAWIEKNLVNCNNPRQHGKPLVANHSGKWRYRIGDYRIIAEIEDEKIIIFIVTIGHRKNIY
jgi:addiction module toxin, RelE/StbE family